VKRAGRFPVGEHTDGALDRPPMAEADDIAEVAAVMGARRRFGLGLFAEARNHLVRFGEGRAIDHMNIVSQGMVPLRLKLSTSRSPFRKCPFCIVNAPFTNVDGWRFAAADAMVASMNEKSGTPIRAGGSILAGAILAGTMIGVIAREPSIGFLVGTSVGLILIGLLWLRDRKK